MTQRHYLDFNATTPLGMPARDAMVAAMQVTGNPSSVHAEGRAAKALIEKARTSIAEGLGCKPHEIVFTSGATEAARVMELWNGPVVVAPTAHDALWAHHRPQAQGEPLFAQGLANSETGILTPPRARADGGATLVDLTQAVGRIAVAFGWMDVDLGIVSAHKFGGPKGIGALIVREGFDINALSKGGGQEMGRRAGTENVAGIAGFAAALQEAGAQVNQPAQDAIAGLRDKLESGISAGAPDAIIVGRGDKRLPNTSCIVTPGWKGETQVMQMDLAGFAISSGSACSSGKVKASRVLQAMGFDHADASCAIRVSIGPQTTAVVIDSFVAAWSAAYSRFRARAA